MWLKLGWGSRRLYGVSIRRELAIDRLGLLKCDMVLSHAAATLWVVLFTYRPLSASGRVMDDYGRLFTVHSASAPKEEEHAAPA